MCTQVSTLVVGDLADREFCDAVSLMREAGDVFSALDIAEALNVLRDDAVQVDLIVIAVSHPWQFGTQEIQQLRTCYPILPVIALMGSWCEGHHRTEASWREVVCVYWHEWSSFWDRELQRLDQISQSTWNFPATSSRAEILAATVKRSPIDESQPARYAGQLIALCGMPYETSDALADVISACGYSSMWLPRAEQGVSLRGVGAILWEGVAADPVELDQLRRIRERLDHPPAIALVDFPRPDTVEKLLSAGAEFVIGKPLLVPDLTAALDAALEKNARNQTSAASSQRNAAA